METQNKTLANNNSKLQKAGKIIAKIGEIAHWIAAVGALVGVILLAVVGDKAVTANPGDAGNAIRIYGFEMTVIDAQGNMDLTALHILLITAIFLAALMAMIFRNVYLILDNSENATPFTPDNVRMVREIGYFTIAIPVVGLIGSIVARLVIGIDTVEASVDMTWIFLGVVMLCLSQFFARGVALESDMDGLV